MDTKDRILNEAEELCSRMMPNNVTLDMIASKAQVGKGTVYAHFSGKEDLFKQLALSLVSRLQEELVAAGFDSSGNYMDKMISIGEAFNGFIEKHPMVIAITIFLKEAPPWLRDKPDHGFFQIEHIFEKMVDNLVKQGIASGELRSDIDEKDLSAFIATTLKANRLMLSKKKVLSPSTLQDLILNGVTSG